jgi:hypothetical protein
MVLRVIPLPVVVALRAGPVDLSSAPKATLAHVQRPVVDVGRRVPKPAVAVENMKRPTSQNGR